MGSDYYAYTMIGVNVSKYVTYESFKKDQHQKLYGEWLYDEFGKPVVRKVTSYNWSFTNSLGVTIYEEEAYDFPTNEFTRFLKEKGLKMVCYDTIRDDSILGIVINEWSTKDKGVYLEELPAMFDRAGELLRNIGITEEVTILTAFWHSF